MATAVALVAGCGHGAHTSGAHGSRVEIVILPEGVPAGGAVSGPRTAPVAAPAPRRHGSEVRMEPIAGAHLPRATRSSTHGVEARRRGHGHDHDRHEESEPDAADERSPAFDLDGEPSPMPGLALPYSMRRVFRGFGACRGNRHFHEAIDVGGVGDDGGLGTPIYAMSRSRVTFIGLPSEDPAQFGTPDRRSGNVVRGGRELPRSKVVPGYGRVFFFTRNYGSWRSGTVIVTVGVGGPLDGHRIRYMHLGAVHPDLKVGDVVEAGQEIGLMGGTAVQQASPHVHIDVEAPDGRRLDVAPLLGLAPTAQECARPGGPESRVWARAIAAPSCGESWVRNEDFRSGRFYAHDVRVRLKKGETVEVAVERTAGRWEPRIEVLDGGGATLYQGSQLTASARGSGLRVRRQATGRRGARAAVRVEALSDVDAVLRVTAWPTERPGLLLPQDGTYRMVVNQRCRSR